MIIAIDPEQGTKQETQRTWLLVVIFDRPVVIKELQFDGSGATLPLSGVKDQSPRHAVILFNGDLQGMVLRLHVIS